MKGSVGILFHPAETEGRAECLRQATRFLDARGIAHWEAPRHQAVRVPDLAGTSLMLTLGGDGTFLHGARLAVPAGVPVLGVNLGRLGFLTELEPSELTSGLERFLAGDFRLEQRTVIAGQLVREGRRLSRLLAINEVVVHRATEGKLARFDISANGQEVGTIDADGVLVGTATGSTAYALALGGPILLPDLKGLLLVPVNPFALTVRPIVLPPGRGLGVALALGEGSLTLDGWLNRSMRQGDSVRLEPYRRALKVVRFGDAQSFFVRLREKIGWGMPLVPLR